MLFGFLAFFGLLSLWLGGFWWFFFGFLVFESLWLFGSLGFLAFWLFEAFGLIFVIKGVF